MSAYQMVVVGTDGSDSSLRAVDRAAAIAADQDAKLIIATAHLPVPEEKGRYAIPPGSTHGEDYRLVGEAPYYAILREATIHTPVDKERATKLVAERMGANPTTDIRPGLLIQLAFAAADFAFQQWVRQSTSRRPLDRYVTEALEAIKSPHWKKKVKL